MSFLPLQIQMYFTTNHGFMPKYIHFFITDTTQGKNYTTSKVPLYHKKNGKHNLTKKSNFFHLNFAKSIFSYFPILYPLYENLYANLQIKASYLQYRKIKLSTLYLLTLFFQYINKIYYIFFNI